MMSEYSLEFIWAFNNFYEDYSFNQFYFIHCINGSLNTIQLVLAS